MTECVARSTGENTLSILKYLASNPSNAHVSMLCAIFCIANCLTFLSKSNQETLRVNGNGYRMGLSVVIDANLDDCSVTNGKFDGFRVSKLWHVVNSATYEHNKIGKRKLTEISIYF